MPDRPDATRCLDALDPEDRATVARWAAVLGLPWHAVPPLRQLVETVAVLLRSADFEDRARGDAVRAAAEALGLEDDGTRATHPADRYVRGLARWLAAASEEGGQSVQPSDAEAA